MKLVKYFFQFFFIISLLFFFKVLGLKISRVVSSKLLSILGNLFRSKKIIEKNISLAFPKSEKEFKNDYKEYVERLW